MKFYYRYIPEGDDVGVIELKIENEDQDVILYEATNVVSKTEYQLYEIPINYMVENVVATKLTLTLKSGSKHTNVVKAKVRGMELMNIMVASFILMIFPLFMTNKDKEE